LSTEVVDSDSKMLFHAAQGWPGLRSWYTAKAKLLILANFWVTTVA